MGGEHAIVGEFAGPARPNRPGHFKPLLKPLDQRANPGEGRHAMGARGEGASASASEGHGIAGARAGARTASGGRVGRAERERSGARVAFVGVGGSGTMRSGSGCA